jgi:hypothetical protein
VPLCLLTPLTPSTNWLNFDLVFSVLSDSLYDWKRPTCPSISKSLSIPKLNSESRSLNPGDDQNGHVTLIWAMSLSISSRNLFGVPISLTEDQKLSSWSVSWPFYASVIYVVDNLISLFAEGLCAQGPVLTVSLVAWLCRFCSVPGQDLATVSTAW